MDRDKKVAEALKNASEALWHAAQMLSAINDSDPSADRRRAYLKAREASNKAKLAYEDFLAAQPTSSHEQVCDERWGRTCNGVGCRCWCHRP